MELKTVGLVSLGCAKNLIDSEHMLSLLLQQGYSITPDPSKATLLIVNTCSFISAAEQEAVDTILEMAQYKMNGKCRKLIVTGCLAQYYPNELANQLPEVDAILGTGVLHKLPSVLPLLEQNRRIVDVGPPGGLLEGPRLVSTPPGSAYLKLSEGCDHHCTYCIIPQLRGPLRSRPEENIVNEARQLVDQGAKELILVAQDTTSYGLDLYGELRLPGLLKKISRIHDLSWIRLLYLYPEYITDELLCTIAEQPKICSYLDIPMQHASNSILQAMGRLSTRDSLERLLDKIRVRLPSAAIRTTFILGFPGETDAKYQELLSFIRNQRFDWVGAFPYSPRTKTVACTLCDQIPEPVKEERCKNLLEEQSPISKSRNSVLIGKTLPVLIEKSSLTRSTGRCFKQSPEVDGLTYILGKAEPGNIVQVNIEKCTTYDLKGRLSSEPT